MKQRFNRKLFIQLLLMGIALPFISVVQKLFINQKNSEKKKFRKLTISANGILIDKNIIVSKGDDYLYVFSSTCPHLNCQITRTEKHEIICPCHGSRFNYRGEVIKGPATHPLTPLKFSLENHDILIVYLP